MAKKFLSSLKLLNLSSNPENGSSGEMFYSNSENLIKYYNGTSWISLSPSGENIVPSGPSYPEAPLVNGQLFYNTTNERTAIYINSFWRELAYYYEVDFEADGGNASSTFIYILDGGFAQ